ncbi:hypothetical protein J1N35_040487 [Gossypium stocksii]|uniref:Transmembrane protein n=1 Tax=Gossypium stocksii TaxID=47602 RepID=A0A9D3ZIV7_9ROSI|nr:hypothetical protein J1N35_040487 [Gossypium stocksii]
MHLHNIGLGCFVVRGYSLGCFVSCCCAAVAVFPLERCFCRFLGKEWWGVAKLRQLFLDVVILVGSYWLLLTSSLVFVVSVSFAFSFKFLSYCLVLVRFALLSCVVCLWCRGSEALSGGGWGRWPLFRFDVLGAVFFDGVFIFCISL